MFKSLLSVSFMAVLIATNGGDWCQESSLKMLPSSEGEIGGRVREWGRGRRGGEEYTDGRIDGWMGLTRIFGHTVIRSCSWDSPSWHSLGGGFPILVRETPQ